MALSVPFFTPKDTNLPEISAENIGEISIRPAKIGDVLGMSALINYYASNNVMLARGPLYLYQHLQDYIVATTKLKNNGQECVVGCAALNVLWSDLAEVRSLAVHQACQHQGLGQKVVHRLIERCRALEVPQVFCFTLVDKFFQSCGFKVFNRELLPPVVWTECSKCPKFYHCDEISMLYEVK
ncbi:MAG: N-acetyltransferase [Desulfovibrionaceae bacterium]|nr:N-acetyltransferase [Desulfovibrionaceae bacterium]